MADKAVFLDRDHTIIEDPGYLTEPSAVRLLPGVDLALQSLAQAGFKLVVVTNQSAIARGLLTAEGLERIHAEMGRQLADRGVTLDGIYHCPYHPEGTVEQYARESDDRKPSPGMLLRAAEDLDIDLPDSWMVGDSPRDIEAGQRAGCRTIRVRRPSEEPAEEDEDVQADFTVRNLVEASRMILRDSGVAVAAGTEFAPAAPPPGPKTAAVPHPPAGAREARPETMTDGQVLREILRHLRQMDPGQREPEFSAGRLIAAIFQTCAIIALAVGLAHIPGMTVGADPAAAYNRQIVVHVGLLAAGVLQLVALTFFILSRQR